MGDNTEILRLGIVAETAQLDNAERSIRRWIEASNDGAKAATQFNAAEHQTAGGVKALNDELNSLRGSIESNRIKSLTASTDEWNDSLQRVRNSIGFIKDDFDDPTLKEALGNVGGSGNFFGRGGTLATIGREGKALPAIPIPGTGLSTDALSKIVGLLGQLGSPEILAAGAALAIVAAGFAILTKSLDDANKALETALKAQDTYYDDLSNRTTQSAKDQIKALQDANTNTKMEMDNIAHNVSVGVNNIKENFSGLIGVVDTVLGKNVGTGLLAKISGVGTDVDKVAELKTKYDENQQSIDALTRSLDDQIVKENDAKAAAEAAAKAQAEYNQKLYDFAQNSIDVTVATQEKIGELVKSGTESQLNAAIESTRQQIEATKLKIDAEYKLAEQYKDDIPKYNAIGDEILKLQAHQTDLQKSLDDLSGSMVRAEVVAADAAKKQAQIQEDSAASYEKYLNDREKIEDTWQDSRLKAADKYQSKLVDIAEAAVKASEDLLNKLEQKRDDIRTKFEQQETDAATDFQQDALDRQIKFQREEARAAEQHQRDIQQIIKDAQEREQDLILNRDFSGLFSLKQETNKQIEEANQNYEDQRRARLEAFQNENEDAQRHFIEDEQQRQVNYERQLQQAQLQYQREYAQAAKNRNDALQKAADAYSKELQLASDKHQKALDMAAKAELAELAVIKQGNDQKLQLEQQFYQQSLAFEAAYLARSGKEGMGRSASLDSPNTGSSRGGISSSTHNYGNSIGTVNYSPAIKGNDDERIAAIAGEVMGKMLEDFLN